MGISADPEVLSKYSHYFFLYFIQYLLTSTSNITTWRGRQTLQNKSFNQIISVLLYDKDHLKLSLSLNFQVSEDCSPTEDCTRAQRTNI